MRNCSGEANGTAYVQFESAAMAKDAFARYNDVALDGKPMKIVFDTGSSLVLSSGIRYTHASLPMSVISVISVKYLVMTPAQAAPSFTCVLSMPTG